MGETADAKSFVELFLTCRDQAEAEKIAQSLLEQHLVACVKFESVRSRYWWQGKLEVSDELELSMLSTSGNFVRIEAELTKLHSYNTFVLHATPVVRLNEAAVTWLAENTK